MDMKKLIIFGAHNFAQIAQYYFKHDSDYEVMAFTVDSEFIKESTYQSLPVIPFEEVEQIYSPDQFDMFVAVGVQMNNTLRERKVTEAEAKGYRLATFLSTKALVPPDLSLLPNTWIMEAAHIHPFVTIGRNTIIWSRSTIGHGTTVGNNCWISAGLCGESVVIGDNTFIGLGSTISSFRTIGKCNLIGAGAVILKDTIDFEVYRGNESKPSRVPSNRLRSFNG